MPKKAEIFNIVIKKYKSTKTWFQQPNNENYKSPSLDPFLDHRFTHDFHDFLFAYTPLVDDIVFHTQSWSPNNIYLYDNFYWQNYNLFVYVNFLVMSLQLYETKYEMSIFFWLFKFYAIKSTCYNQPLNINK